MRQSVPTFRLGALVAKVLGGVLLATSISACGASHSQKPASSDLSPVRAEARLSVDTEVVGRWLLHELISPGGSPKYAKEARQRLEGKKNLGMYALLGLGLDDSLHGRVKVAGDTLIQAFLAARESNSEVAPLVAWFALRQAVELRRDSRDLFEHHQKELDAAIRHPKNIGWRARIQLVSWKAAEARANKEKSDRALEAKVQGCAENISLSGPFGTGQRSDIVRKFDAERLYPLPAFFAREAGAAQQPRALKTDTAGCVTFADEPVSDGVFFGEATVVLSQPTQLILAVEGAYKVWVDDVVVQDRDPRRWARWPRWGVALRLPSGRHRILAKLQRPSTALRLMQPDGTPLSFESVANSGASYELRAPEILADPNLLSHFTSEQGIVEPTDDIVRFLAADTANIEGQGDLATLLFEPLIRDRKQATGTSLYWASRFVNNDPLLGGSMASDAIKQLEQLAVGKDGGLFAPQLSRALMDGEQRGATEAVAQLKKLTATYPQVSASWSALQRTYGELGWTTEQARLSKELAERFPENPEMLMAAVQVYEQEGDPKRAQELTARIVHVDKDNEIEFTRALERQDYGRAMEALSRLVRMHPDRPELKSRLEDLRVRAGIVQETTDKLKAQVLKDPLNSEARLGLADAKLAKGDGTALTQAVVEGTMAGANTGPILDAIDLISGKTELEPYRLDALAVIRDYEAENNHQPGTAARVLDYSAVWVRSDGSSRMLEHEIVRIQSSEAIQQFAESQKLDGLVLHMRVIKKDGQVFEPENVQGKPTVTLPHLEVGDYVETEHISSIPSQDRSGDRYIGPRWFFREENIAYARSEFLVISPKNRPLTVETRGQVPKPEVVDLGSAVLRRWRVDRSPAAPKEPYRASVEEFLPSVYVGWGVKLEQRLLELSRDLVPMTPVDPRIRALAAKIVEKVRLKAERARAEALYRWVLDNVQPGEASDGRQVIMTREGNRWRAFMELCRAVDMQVDFALVKNRLAAEPLGSLSQAAEFSDPALRIQLADGEQWLWMNSKYAKFGFLPEENRGMPAYLLSPEGPRRAFTPEGALSDGVTYAGRGSVNADGSALLELRITYEGANAIGLRTAVAGIPEVRLQSTLESELFGQLIEGARLKAVKILNSTDFNLPLVFVATLEVPHFANTEGNTFSVSPPFASQLTSYASLPSRQTPLVMQESVVQAVDLELTLPANSRHVQVSPARALRDGPREITISDTFNGKALHLSRKVKARAARVTPAEYGSFQRFARQGEALLSANIRFEVGR
ncbi:MAG: hypothetical protein SFV15_14055 [Polyangiaceae bacterium]|nr:hypothetical protein [Polyangiaceae bacterium]